MNALLVFLKFIESIYGRKLCSYDSLRGKKQKWAVPYPAQIVLSAYYLIQISSVTLFYDNRKAAVPFYCTILAQRFLSQRCCTL